MKKRNVIIDTDPGIDDAIAIGIALHNPTLDVKLITTVAGNVNVSKVTENTLKLLTFWGKSIPVAKGSSQPLLKELSDASDVHGETGMDGFDFPKGDESLLVEGHAVNEMYKTIMREGQITLVAIGPLTNIALLLKMYPEIKDNIYEIVIMGGALGRGNKGVLAEFNIEVDPESAKIVFESGCKIVAATLDVGLKALVYPEDSEKIKGMNPTGEMMYSLFKKYRGGSFSTGLKMYDACAIAYLLEPQMFSLKETFVGVEVNGQYTSGATVIDLKDYLNKEANCVVCVDIDPILFKQWFMTAIESCF